MLVYIGSVVVTHSQPRLLENYEMQFRQVIEWKIKTKRSVNTSLCTAN